MTARPETGDPQRLAEAAQRRAARPDSSAWVSASAGSGKTKVLVDRSLALLLRGAAPGRLLCLTFTKAAAAEMANRLAERLAIWATLPEAALAEAIAPLLDGPPRPEQVALARGLFARVLDEPGGMKIQTIHGFCQSVLGRFPLEAAVAPHFRVMDERSAGELLQEAREESLTRGAGGLEPALGEVTRHVQEQAFMDLMAALLKERGRLASLAEGPGALDALMSGLRRRLGLDDVQSEAALIEAACADAALDLMGLRVVLDGLLQGGKTDRERGEKIAAWLEAPERRAELLPSYLSAFFKEGGEGDVFKTLIHKQALAAAGPGAEAILTQEAQRLYMLRERLRAEAVLRATAGLLRIGAAILELYGRHKERRALLDYDDLILRTRDLLSAAPGRAAWVLYKLDGGLEHVLIDEAQDTNPEQWQVVQMLTEEFFVGEGRAEGLRSIFAVGDPKQSIYGFQRAEPRRFAAMRDHYEDRAESAGQNLEQVSLAVSFRSAAPVLALVDKVFEPAQARDGLFLGDEPLAHIAARQGDAGLVELWPPVEPVEPAAVDPWGPPEGDEADAAADLAEPPLRLASLIARRIWRWTRDPDAAAAPEAQLASKQRRIEPGDVMVLVRRRNLFVEALVRALKRLDVPVAGVDRMVLSEQLAVMDLVALGRTLLLPEDDLTLATVLKSPLIGLDEEALFLLAHKRGEASLWSALRDRAARVEGAPAALETLSALMARADFVRPFELYAELLGAGGGREKLIARLGPDANDPIDEFLGLALAYEREHLPSLEGFLHWFEAGGQEVKRDLEQGTGAVRVMTVHGAKGLQAPIVILPDTRQLPPQERGLLWLDTEEDAALPLWPLSRRYDFEAAVAARQGLRREQEREHRRLLYVAMTRAEDRLYVCGWDTRRAAPEECWYALIERAMRALGEPYDFDCRAELDVGGGGGWAGPAWRLQSTQTAPPEKDALPRDCAPEAPLPDWAGRPPPPEPALPRPLTPSRPGAPEPAAASPLAEVDPYRRGLLIHRLLQHLPDLPPERREAAAKTYLAQLRPVLPAEARAAMIADVAAVLEHPEAVALFGSESRAEVPIAGVVVGRDGGSLVVAGQVDRLVVASDRVLLVDYKTNREPPTDSSAVSFTYLRQMASYRAVLRNIFPDRPIHCSLLWTVGPRLMQLSDDLLAGHAP